MNTIMKKIQQYGTSTVFLLLVLFAVAGTSWIRARRFEKIKYLEHLDERAVTIDNTEYQFRDLAFYLAYQEQSAWEQAKAYDLEHPKKYWNLRGDSGAYIRSAARDIAMDMKIHDVIFYEMAVEDNVTLTQEEITYMENQKSDFWSDLEEEGRIRLGVSEDEIAQTFEMMALAQKEQQLFADKMGVDFREYNINGDSYQELLSEHTYEINEKLWERINFGNITLD